MNNTTNILVFIDWYLPGYKAGGPIRSMANLVSRVPYNFFIVTSAFDHYATIPYDLPTKEWIKRSDNEQVMYLMPGELNRQLFDSIIASRHFDFYYINSLFSSSFAIKPLRWLRQSNLAASIVLAPRGMLQPGALSIKPLKKKLFLAVAKSTGLFENITWHATGMDEQTEIQRHFRNARVKIAQNVSRIAKTRVNRPEKTVGTIKLITVARVSREKNLLGAAEYLKGVKGEVVWDIYGTVQDDAYLDSCVSVLKNSSVTITFKGEVDPERLPALYERYHFFYLMTLGENFGHAITESLICGMPVIISDRTPWKNLSAANAGWELPLESAVVAQVLNLAIQMDEGMYNELCQGATKLGRQIADDSTAFNQSVALFQ